MGKPVRESWRSFYGKWICLAISGTWSRTTSIETFVVFALYFVVPYLTKEQNAQLVQSWIPCGFATVLAAQFSWRFFRVPYEVYREVRRERDDARAEVVRLSGGDPFIVGAQEAIRVAEEIRLWRANRADNAPPFQLGNIEQMKTHDAYRKQTRNGFRTRFTEPLRHIFRYVNKLDGAENCGAVMIAKQMVHNLGPSDGESEESMLRAIASVLLQGAGERQGQSDQVGVAPFDEDAKP